MPRSSGSDDFFRVIVNGGFKERPDVLRPWTGCKPRRLVKAAVDLTSSADEPS